MPKLFGSKTRVRFLVQTNYRAAMLSAAEQIPLATQAVICAQFVALEVTIGSYYALLHYDLIDEATYLGLSGVGPAQLIAQNKHATLAVGMWAAIGYPFMVVRRGTLFKRFRGLCIDEYKDAGYHAFAQRTATTIELAVLERWNTARCGGDPVLAARIAEQRNHPSRLGLAEIGACASRDRHHPHQSCCLCAIPIPFDFVAARFEGDDFIKTYQRLEKARKRLGRQNPTALYGNVDSRHPARKNRHG